MSEKTTGEILKYLRQCNNYSQKDVADSLNLSVSAISQYETGKRNLSANEIVLFADFYHVSCDYLLGKEKIDTKDLLEKKLKLSYEITVKSSKDSTSLFEKFMICLFYISSLVLIFLPGSKFLFSFALTIQLIFIIYFISKKLFENHNATKRRFTIPDDVTVYYEYKNSNQEFMKLLPLKNSLLLIMAALNVIVVILSIYIFPYYEHHNSYFLLLMLISSFTAALIYEGVYYSFKTKLYKKIDYFDYGTYLRRTLGNLLEIISYFIFILFMLIYLNTTENTILGTIFGLFLILEQIVTHIYSHLLKYILNSYSLYAMLNDTLEVKKLA